MDGATTTIKSRVHDVFQHTDFWHERYDGRAIIGPNYKDFLDGVEKYEITRRYEQAKANGEQERVTIWAYVFLHLSPYILPSGGIMLTAVQRYGYWPHQGSRAC